MEKLADVLILWLCLALLVVGFIIKLFTGYEILAPCNMNNTCTVAAIEKYESERGRIPTCEQLAKADARECPAE